MKFVLVLSSITAAQSAQVPLESNTLLQASKKLKISQARHVAFDSRSSGGPLRPLPEHLNAEEKGCINMDGTMVQGVSEDCTLADFFVFRGTINDAKGVFRVPTFNVSEYGQDDWWMTTPVQEYEQGAWIADCVAYIDEYDSGQPDTCKNWCENRDMVCVRGMDDAHKQTGALDDWLAGAGYSGTNCTLIPNAHHRQNQDENGCLQTWETQVCACSHTTTTTPVPCDPPASPLFEPESCSLNASNVSYEFEDCTGKKFFTYKKSVPVSKDTGFVAGPDWMTDMSGNYSAASHTGSESQVTCGEDDNWSVSGPGDDWDVSCIAYVNKGKGGPKFTCEEWCADQGQVCHIAMDDAHHQTEGLSTWLGTDATDCTLQPQGHGRQPQDDNGCKQSWESQICGCANSRPAAYDCGCHDISETEYHEDCTFKDIFEFKGGVQEVVAPTYNPEIYGSDAMWKTHKAPSGGWLGATCVAYVATDGETCSDWCQRQGKECIMGWNDAHHQTSALDDWLAPGNATRCTYSAAATARQASTDNGCLQTWQTQMCACGPAP